MKVSALLSEQAQSPTGLNPAVETVAHLARQVKGSPNLEGWGQVPSKEGIII